MDDAEYEEILRKGPSRDPNNPDFSTAGVRLNTEGCTYRVISQPSTVVCPMGITYTQYSTTFTHMLEVRPNFRQARRRALTRGSVRARARAQKMEDDGWKDEGFESANEAECLDWITTRPDHSLTVVLKNNPDLAEKVRRSRKTTFGLGPALEAYNNDFRRGKFV